MKTIKTKRSYTISDKSRKLRDHSTVAAPGANNNAILQQYYEHVHALFLKKLDTLSNAGNISETEHKRLVGLFNEVIRVKGMLLGEDPLS